MKLKVQKLPFTIFFVLISNLLLSQNLIRGVVWDGDYNEALAGANIVEKGINNGITSNVDGSFELNLSSENAEIEISFIGYKTETISVDIKNGEIVNIGTISLFADAVGLQEIQLVADVAIDRKTPVAVSTISPVVIEEKLGTQEYVEILKSTPGVYTTKQGGGRGDGRINIRGFSMNNVAVMINGIPVNAMENGWVYWSNWEGLSDVTRSVQVQRGLGASKLTIGSVGGTINIVTKSADSKKGAEFYAGIGNDGRNKQSITLSTGLTENNWAFTVSGSRSSGKGWADATSYSNWSYFANLVKSWDKHTISLTVFGAPQTHGQRISQQLISDIEQTEEGMRYNPDWGYKNGEMQNLNINYYHKPQLSLNHYWNIDESTKLSTSVYASTGQGGATFAYGSEANKFYDDEYRVDGLIGFDRIIAENEANPNRESTAIISSYYNYHNWFGIISNLQKNINENLEFSTGIDGRYFYSKQYLTVGDLLGGDYLIDNSNLNNPNFYATEGDIIGFNNAAEILWMGLFAQLEYSYDKLSAFTSASINNQGARRTDSFAYNTGVERSDWINHLGYVIKAGANYNIDDYNNVFVNTGYFERVPFFDAIFINYKNDVNDGVLNEKTLSFEAGYGYRSTKFSANINAYYTFWRDKFFKKDIIAENGIFYHANLSGVNATHMGIEGDFIWKPFNKLNVEGSFSLGNWFWANNLYDVQIFDNNQKPVGDPVDIYMKDLKVGDAAQTALSLNASYEVLNSFNVGVNFNYFDNLYSQFDPTGRTLESEAGINSWKVPSYNLLDLNMVYRFEIYGLEASVYANINNIFNTRYTSDSVDGASHNMDSARVFYGIGRTWSSGIKLKL